MTTASTRSRTEILRYFFALVVVLGLSAVIMTVWTYAVQRSDREQRQRLVEFHLRVAFLTGEAQSHLERLKVASDAFPVADDGAARTEPGTQRDREIQTAVLALGHAIRSAAVLHEDWRTDVDAFSSSVERAERQYDLLRDAARSGGEQRHEEISRRSDALRFTLHQLDRLHAIAATAELGAVARSGVARERSQILAIASVTLIAVFLIWRLLSTVRARLREQEVTDALLRDRERQLRHSSKMEALGTLVGGVAHDFNNILTAVLGNVEWLQAERDVPARHRASLDEIQKAGERAAALTRQLLTFSRHQPVSARVVDLNVLLADLEPMLRRLIREDVVLSVELDSEPGIVEVDPVQMEQVLLNLAVNARDAMAEGGELTVRVSNERLDQAHPENTSLGPGRYVRILVQDTGCGMSEAAVARAFDPFYTTKTPEKGTGLGLSTVHGIVSKSGGHILVRSELGRGTRFEIFLPRSQLSAEAEAAGGAGAATSMIAGGSEVVLLAEDDARIRTLAARALRDAGYTVLEAGDGQEGLDVCRSFGSRIDIIVSDVVMPGMRGPEMVDRARELHPGVAVLFISGYNEEELFGRGERERPALLAKPFTMTELLTAVSEQLDRAGRRARRGERLFAGPDA